MCCVSFRFCTPEVIKVLRDLDFKGLQRCILKSMGRLAVADAKIENCVRPKSHTCRSFCFNNYKCLLIWLLVKSHCCRSLFYMNVLSLNLVNFSFTFCSHYRLESFRYIVHVFQSGFDFNWSYTLCVLIEVLCFKVF